MLFEDVGCWVSIEQGVILGIARAKRTYFRKYEQLFQSYN